MYFLAVAFLLFAVSALMLLAPVAAVSADWGSGRFFARLLLQLLPVLLVTAFFQYAETHMRIPLFSYERPSRSAVFLAVAALQFVATLVVLRPYVGSVAKKAMYVAGAGVGVVGVAVVALGVVSCMNGNCL